MNERFEEAFAITLDIEKGYIDDPKDSGGKTKYGISQQAYPLLDIKSLTIDDAKSIYKKDYWDKLKLDEIHSKELACSLFDSAVNLGQPTLSRLMQRAVKVEVDGFVGVKTLEAVNAIDEELFVLRLFALKTIRYVKIVENDKKNKRFFYGWIKKRVVNA